VRLQVVVVVALLEKLLALHLEMPVVSWLVVLQTGLLVGTSHYWKTAEQVAWMKARTSLSD